jgi:hypothetical protein
MPKTEMKPKPTRGGARPGGGRKLGIPNSTPKIEKDRIRLRSELVRKLEPYAEGEQRTVESLIEKLMSDYLASKESKTLETPTTDR